ncbi:MAG: DUF1631 family protein [Betaproteobacteria bacterium]|nr:MAG: DUF1631 family protein [Betaproteobacteria bacterium]
MPQAVSFDSILEQCRDLVTERVSDALTKMLDEADEALTALGSQSRDPETSELYEVTRNKVVSQREAIVAQFRMRFHREFQERSNRVKKIGDKFAEVDLSSLEPIAEDDPNESLKFNAMASRLRQYCDQELLALNQRVGVLLGDADLQSEDNPFTPQAIVDAYKYTCRQIDSNVDVQMVLLKLFDDYVLDEIRGVYKAVNALLIENSILPKIRISDARGKEGAKAQSGEQKPVRQAPSKEQDLVSQLQQLLAGKSQAIAQPGGDASGITGGSVPPTEVSGAPVPANILQELKNNNLGSSMNKMDAMTLDIMAMSFDKLFGDPKIPTTVKGLIGRLQMPMLRLAIADKSFVSKTTHPARQMLDKLGELSAGLPADINESDPIYGKLESVLQELIDGFEGDIKIFDEMRQQLDTLIGEMNERAQEETQPIARQVDLEEKLALAKTVAQEEIKVRVRASGAPQLIVKFLVQQWFKVLVVMHVKEGEESEAWKAALETVDVLLWSGETKETSEERQKLVGAVPGLLKRVAVGLSYAGIDNEIRVQFFADLRKLHAANIDRPAQASVEALSEESVIEGGSEEAGTNVASAKPDAVQGAEANDAIPDSEAAATIAEPDAAETSDTAEAGTSQETQLEAAPAEGETAEISELPNKATAKTSTLDDKSALPDSLPASLELEAVAEKPAAQDALPDHAAPSADSPAMTLEFESGLSKPGEQDAAPDDAAASTDSTPMTLEFETGPEGTGEQGAASADAATGEQSAPPNLGLPVAPKPTESTTSTPGEPSAQLLAEMDNAMEATRTLFSDVDRFLILGKVQSAISLLDFRITREPTDRDSWIKLMAVYREEGMEDDFGRTFAAFREQFGESQGS